jgi:hypothetical protein
VSGPLPGHGEDDGCPPYRPIDSEGLRRTVSIPPAGRGPRREEGDEVYGEEENGMRDSRECLLRGGGSILEAGLRSRRSRPMKPFKLRVSESSLPLKAKLVGGLVKLCTFDPEALWP